jgi:hypothetical protein
VLATLFCAAALGVCQLWQSLPCQANGTLAGTAFCQVTLPLTAWITWQDAPRQIITLVIISAIYILVWIITFTFGMKPVQIRRSRQPIPQFLRSISEFRTIARVFYIYAGIAFLAFLIMFFAQRISILAFSLCSMILFTANSFVFHPMKRIQRRQYTLGYAVAAGICLAIMFVLHRLQGALMAGEIAIILAGLFWAVPSLWRERGKQAVETSNRTPSQRLSELNQQALEPREVFRAWVLSLRRGTR